MGEDGGEGETSYLKTEEAAVGVVKEAAEGKEK